MHAFRRAQLRTMLLCWLVYAVVYFGRLNLSIALPALEEATGAGKATLGLIGTLFFWCYGVGQLLGGALGDRVRIRYLVTFGLAASAGCNLLFAFAVHLPSPTLQLPSMYVLWSLNGVFQSLIWGPLVKTLVRWVEPARRNSAMIGVSTSMVGGFLLAWGVLGQWLGAGRDLRGLFLLPACALGFIALAWGVWMRDKPEDAGFQSPWLRFPGSCGRKGPNHPSRSSVTSDSVDTSEPVGTSEFTDACDPVAASVSVDTSEPVAASKSTEPSASFWAIAHETRLWLIIIACFAQGIVRDGITLWAPTFLLEAHGLTMQEATTSILFLPLMNLGGILLAGWLTDKMGKRAEPATALMFLVAMLLLGGMRLFGGQGLMVAVFLLGLASGMMYGVNTLLLGVVPLRYEAYGRASLFSGTLNFLAYMASGLASVFTGLLVESTGWNGVLLSWVLMAAGGSAALLVHAGIHRRSATLAASTESTC